MREFTLSEYLTDACLSRFTRIPVDDEHAWEVAQRRGIAYLRSTELVLEAYRRQLLDADMAKSKLVELGKKRWISQEVVEAALRQLKA